MTATSRSRRKGVGSITDYQTKGGTRWRWQVFVPADPDVPGSKGRTVGKGGYVTDKAADEALQEHRRQSKLHWGQLRTSGIPTVELFAQQWLDGLGLAPSTIQGYRKIVRNQLVPQLGALRLDQVTPARMKAHYTSLLAGGRNDRKGKGGQLSASSVNKAHVVIGAILEAAVDAGHIALNPARHKSVNAPTLRQARAERPETPTWTAAELDRFLAWNRDMARDPFYTLWYTIANTGMRRSEAAALRWGDVTLTGDEPMIMVKRAADVTQRGADKDTKTYRHRAIALDAELVAELRRWRTLNASVSFERVAADTPVFLNRAGDMHWPDGLSKRWSFRMEQARAHLGEDQLPRITIHGLRHTHGNILSARGVNPAIVQQRLGHADISMTLSTYTHVDLDMQRQALTAWRGALATG